MKRFRQCVAIIMIIVVSFSINIFSGGNGSISVQGATTFSITSPSNNVIVGAGHIDIKWNSAGSVKNYNVYVDGKCVTTTTSTTYEFYTTKVNYHTAWIEANLTNGKKSYTPTVKFGVTKKGLCVDKDMGKNLDPVSMKMGWYYTWGTSPFSYTTYPKIEFVPMIWGTGSEGAIPSVRSKNYKYVLGYNEPDMQGNGGSNINVNVAINNWGKFSGIGRYVGSPAPAFSPSWNNGSWFRTFMNGIDQSSIDFIPLHCYYEGWAGAAAANAFLTEVVDGTYKMYHKPIWITEYAPSKLAYSNAGNRASVNEYLKKTIDGLNSRDYVVRYSWFSFGVNSGDGAAALWHSNGALTDLGKTYVSHGNPTTEYKIGDAVNPYKPQSTAPPQKATVKKPGKVTIKSVKNLKKRKVKLTLRRVKNAVGYQIKICDNKKFNGFWTKSIKKISYTFKKLDKNTRYYYKARAYVMNGKNKLYGPWSKAKSVKVTK